MKVEAIYDLKDVQRLYNHIKTKGTKRDLILYSLGINTGFRIKDLLSLKKKDVLGDTITIDESKTRNRKDGKNRPPRTVGITEQLKQDLENYLPYLKNDDYLFPSRKANAQGEYVISTTQAYRILTRYTKEIGLDINVGCHTLRKTWGYHMYQKYHDVAFLMKAFNHGDTSTTLLYIGASRVEVVEKTKSLDFGITV
jgi:integrase